MPETFRTRRVIRFEDVDPVGVIYFPRQIALLMSALEEMFRDRLRLPWGEMIARDRVGLPTVEWHTTFRAPLRLGDEVEITIGVAALEPRKVTVVYEATNVSTAQLAATARQLVVCVDAQTWTARPLPEKYRLALEPFQMALAPPAAGGST